jgi:putative Mn2+ efflux pump MntP
MTLALVLGLLTGADNFWFGLAFGLLPLSSRARLNLAAGFAIAEIGMTLAGFAFGPVGFGGGLNAAYASAAAGILVLAACARRADTVRLASHPAGIVLLPLALSLDNLAAGAGLSNDGVAAAAGAALVSAGLAAAGLFLAAPLAERRPVLAARAAGIVLAALAVPHFIEAVS